MNMRWTYLGLALLTFSGCDDSGLSGSAPPPPAGEQQQHQVAQKIIPANTQPPALPTDYRMTTAARVVAIGDLHGDYDATLRAFELAGAIDSTQNWIGGNMVVVQLGNVMDYGNDDREVMDWLEKIETHAEEHGGHVMILNGNHELMNANRDMRFVTHKGFEGFLRLPLFEPTQQLLSQGIQTSDGSSSHIQGEMTSPFNRAIYFRGQAFQPGYEYANRLAKHPLYYIVNDTVFVNGGIFPYMFNYQGLKRAKLRRPCRHDPRCSVLAARTMDLSLSSLGGE